MRTRLGALRVLASLEGSLSDASVHFGGDRIKKGGFRGVKKGVFGGTKTPFFGGRKGGFLRCRGERG